jgi:hypothetical protein
MPTYTYSSKTATCVRRGTFVLRSIGLLAAFDPTRSGTPGMGCIRSGEAAGFAQGFYEIEFNDGSILTATGGTTDNDFQPPGDVVAVIATLQGSQWIAWQLIAGGGGTPYETFYSPATPHETIGNPGTASLTSAVDFGNNGGWPFRYAGRDYISVGLDVGASPSGDVLAFDGSATLAVVAPWQGPDTGLLGSSFAVPIGSDYLQAGSFPTYNCFLQVNGSVLPTIVRASSTTGGTIDASSITLEYADDQAVLQTLADIGQLFPTFMVAAAPYSPDVGYGYVGLGVAIILGADGSWYESYQLEAAPGLATDVLGAGGTMTPENTTMHVTYGTQGPYAYLMRSDTEPGYVIASGLAGPQLLSWGEPVNMVCVPCAPVLFDPAT